MKQLNLYEEKMIFRRKPLKNYWYTTPHTLRSSISTSKPGKNFPVHSEQLTVN